LLINPVNGGNVQVRFGRTLNNVGAANWTNGNTSLYLVNNSTFNNLASGSFTASSAGLLQVFGTGGVDNFNNAGSYTKAGAGTNRFQAIFNNSNLVNVTAGRLDLSGGGANDGTFSGAGTIEFGASTYLLDNGSTLTVSNVDLSAGTVTNLGAYNAAGVTTLRAGTFRFQAPGTMGTLVESGAFSPERIW
jgi:hypothetical protein